MESHTSEPWNRRRVFVTGASGMIGSQLTRTLLSQGAEVIALVRDYVPQSELLHGGPFRDAPFHGGSFHGEPSPGETAHGTTPRATKDDHAARGGSLTIVPGELENYRTLERAIAEYEIEVVFHLGAQTLVQIAQRAPIGTFRANIEGTWNLLEACRQVPTPRAIVVASSDKAYGACDDLPYTEETPLRAQHPYDVSKACADLIARTYGVSYQLPVAITRCGNIFGPGDINFSRIVPGTIRSVLLNEPPLIRSDGTMVRDYIYVADAVEGYLRTAQRLLEQPEALAGEAFNFSTQRPLSVLEITQLILRTMQRTDLEPRILNTARSEIPAQALSAEKAERMLGWKSRYSLEQGIEATIPFVRSVVEGA
jgi:CDP-glucose 4,6-dehydratase